mgnify:CR=1 FL=1
MNHREPPQLPVGARRVLRCLSLLLLPAMAPKTMFPLSRPRPLSGQPADLQELELAPYLPLVGPPPLRFQEELPPPDLVTHPAAGAPPTPALTPTESSVALANAAAAQSASTNSRPPVEVPAAAARPAPKSTPSLLPPVAPAPETPPAILPDDARPTVRPEDFLPYFQIPGSATQPGDVNVLVPAPRAAPAPAPLPPSSATYIQSK